MLVKYTSEQPPERGRPLLGLCRVRPLPRRSVLALHEAAFREGAANQRWYRVFYALCPRGQGAFLWKGPALRGKIL